MTKIELVKQSVQMYINVKTEEIERLKKDIQRCANNDSAYDLVTFLPGKIRDLQKAMDELRLYNEQMKALEFLEKED